MEVLRVKITGLTASFRYPTFISGFQPSLPVPPLSTIYGLLSAAKGSWVTPADTDVAYHYKMKGKSIDLETIHTFNEQGKRGDSNVIRREFHFRPEIYLYLTNYEFEKYFKYPHFALLLGRSGDLAFVEHIERIDLEKTNEAVVSNSLLPYRPNELIGVAGPIFPLPVYCHDTIPRRVAKIEIFCLQETEQIIKGDNLYFDPELKRGIYMHSYR
jgi:CRISPR-associated protein Cas5t